MQILILHTINEGGLPHSFPSDFLGHTIILNLLKDIHIPQKVILFNSVNIGRTNYLIVFAIAAQIL